jgi:hypothetical protein
MFSSNTSQVSGGGYQISRSLRFNSADSAYLNRTPAGAGNRTTWTWSGWAKLGALSTSRVLFSAITGSNETTLYFDTSNRIDFYDYASSAYTGRLQTTQVFRDPSAWYHIVAVWNSGNATAGDRMRLYINGSEVTAFGIDTNPALNTNSVWNQAIEHRLGGYSLSSIPWDGYMTEVNFIDGQALTPSSFGETNAQTGVWQPKAYSGSYGTNGFYLNFSDNSNTTAATLGKDYSGNGNNWTPNNFSVTAGAGNDSLVDSPTAYGTDTGAGGTVRGNYCTWNPIDTNTSTAFLTNGNLQAQTSSNAWANSRGTSSPTTGKWYFECTNTTFGDYAQVGVIAMNRNIPASYPGGEANAWVYANNGYLYNNGGITAFPGSNLANGDVLMIAYDNDAGKVWFGRNGTWYNSGNPAAGTNASFNTATIVQPIIGVWGSTTVQDTNFGQRPFAYTAPSGFKALCTQNLPTPTIGATTATQASQYFAPVIYTGTGAAQTITVGFQPDFVWLKSRVSAVWYHQLYDVIRSPLKALFSNATDAETTYTDTLTAFASNGFSLGTDATYNGPVNKNGDTYVSWNWKANGSGSSNTAGSITSTVSANTTSGFSIVTYTGNGTDNATIGHGLGASPQLIIVKSRSNVTGWPVWHGTFAANDYMTLDTTAAKASASSLFGGSNASLPTSTVFKVGANGSVNASSYTYVAYCFAEVPGFSAFGSYTGNGSTDGPFVFTGFRPAFVLIKASSATSDWWLYDTKRATFNVANAPLYPNGSFAESPASALDLDILSNGFKSRSNNGTVNGNGVTYVYACFAENPFKYSLAR